MGEREREREREFLGAKNETASSEDAAAFSFQLIYRELRELLVKLLSVVKLPIFMTCRS